MKRLLFILLIFSLSNLYSQEKTKSKLPDWNGSIEQQFKEVYSKSGKYQEYKVIKASWFNRLRKNVNDSILYLKNQIVSQQKSINKLEENINSLKDQISVRDKKIKDLEKEKDSIRFLGADISKSTYNLILWFIIAFLTVGLVFFVYRFMNSNAITKETLEKYNDLSSEYQHFRTRSLEREQSLKRQLIDEINKHNS
jgi:hypothetical protein